MAEILQIRRENTNLIGAERDLADARAASIISICGPALMAMRRDRRLNNIRYETQDRALAALEALERELITGEAT